MKTNQLDEFQKLVADLQKLVADITAEIKQTDLKVECSSCGTKYNLVPVYLKGKFDYLICRDCQRIGR